MVDLVNNLKQNHFNKIKQAFETQDFLSVISLCPNYMDRDSTNPWVHCYFGYALFMAYGANEADMAFQYMAKAIKLDPKVPEFYTYLGNAQRDGTKPAEAINCYLKALEIDPNNHFAIYNLGVAYISLGDIESGINCILQAVTKCDSLKYLEDLLQFIYYDPRFKNPDYLKIGKLFYQTAKQKHNIKPFTYEPSRYEIKKAPIKIGFFCAEGIDTPTWSFLEKIFQKLSKEKFEVYCYLRPPTQVLRGESQDLRRIKRTVHKWTYCNSLSVKDTAILIHEDELDVLIDLSGYLPSYYGYYSSEPNMLIMMYKPAPVLINWYGFWGTSGIPEMDYLITVEDNVPPNQDQYFSEKIYRLTHGYTHTEIFSGLPDINLEQPCEKNGYVTFTSFSRAVKLNSKVYDLWAEILKRAPNSKLLIKYYMTSEEYMIETIKSNFKARGVDPERIIIDPRKQRREEFISVYNEVDIGLEPVPFGGITTTINALSMGVPVVAKYEEDRVTNGGSCSLLKSIGLNNLAANSDEEYINAAVALANDVELLKTYRKTLRDKTLNSTINAENYTIDLQKAFINIWEDCCARQQAVITAS